MPSREKLQEFFAWCGKNITGDETFRSGTTAQIFLDRLSAVRRLDVGGATEFRISKADEDSGGTASTDYVPMKMHGKGR